MGVANSIRTIRIEHALPVQLRENLGMFQRHLTLRLLQKYRDTNGRHIVIQIGGVYTTL